MDFTFVSLLIHSFSIILIWTIGGDCCSTGELENDRDDCCIGYYNDGISCKACPAGYYGINCSDVCSQSYYGVGCITKCECSPCHHIYGCMLFTAVTQTVQRMNTMKMESMKTTTYGLRKRAGNTMEATRSETNIGRILIVSTGSVISFVLISIIVRVTYTYHRLSPTFNP